MPASEMRPLLGGTGAWLSAIVTHKILRTKVIPTYAVELRRMTKARHIPKRMQKHLDDRRAQLESLNFAVSFYATLPAIGPYSWVTMGMSRRDGDLHFLATQIATKVDGQIQDEGYFCFVSWLSDETSIVTMSPALLPRPSDGVDRVIVGSEDSAVVLKKHRERLRKKEILPVAPTDPARKVSPSMVQASVLPRRVTWLPS